MSSVLTPASSIRLLAQPTAHRGSFARVLLLGWFVAFLLISLFLVKASVGVPVRTLLLAGGAVFIVVAFYEQFRAGLRCTRTALLVSAALAIIGFAISSLNGNDLDSSTIYFLRFILQPMILLTFLGGVVFALGARAFALSFVILVSFSIFVAIGQFVGIGLFWAARDALSAYQDDMIGLARQLTLRERPMGLSLTPIHLSYQISIAYMIIKILYFDHQLSRFWNYCWIGLFLVGAFASGNRSTIGAILIAEALYAILTRDRTVILALPVGAAMVGWLLTSDVESRVLSVSDGSAQGRLPLAVLGLNYIMDNPLGYGWGFDSRDYAHLYWNVIAGFNAARNAELYGLHNFFLNFLVTYGVTLLPIAALVFMLRPERSLLFILIFLPYFINALVHNGGPFYGDNFFWFALVLFLVRARDWRIGAPPQVPHGEAKLGRVTSRA